MQIQAFLNCDFILNRVELFRQHRKILIEWTQDPSKDLRLTEIVLSRDAKNYHAWQHRQWIVKTFK